MNTAEPRGTNPGLCETDAVTNGKTETSESLERTRTIYKEEAAT